MGERERWGFWSALLPPLSQEWGGVNSGDKVGGRITPYWKKGLLHSRKVSSQLRKVSSEQRKVISELRKVRSELRIFSSELRKVSSELRKASSKMRKVSSDEEGQQ